MRNNDQIPQHPSREETEIRVPKARKDKKAGCAVSDPVTCRRAAGVASSKIPRQKMGKGRYIGGKEVRIRNPVNQLSSDMRGCWMDVKWDAWRASAKLISAL